MLLRRHRPDNRALSALLDGRLVGREMDALRAHTASCEACRQRLAALRRTRDSLRALPQADAPRSFRLRAADIAEPAPVRRAPATMRAMPLLGAAAALVFIVVLEADLARGGSSTALDRETGGLQALSSGTRGAGSAAAPGGGEIAPDDSEAPAAGEDAGRGSDSDYATKPTPAATTQTSGGAGSPPGPLGPTPADASPAPPDAAGVPQPAFGSESGEATPTPATASDSVAPIAPTTSPEPQAKTAKTQQPATAGGRESTGGPTPQSTDAYRAGGGSRSRSDVAYRIAEAVAAATALAAIAVSVGWRIRNRRLGP